MPIKKRRNLGLERKYSPFLPVEASVQVQTSSLFTHCSVVKTQTSVYLPVQAAGAPLSLARPGLLQQCWLNPSIIPTPTTMSGDTRRGVAGPGWHWGRRSVKRCPYRPVDRWGKKVWSGKPNKGSLDRAWCIAFSCNNKSSEPRIFRLVSAVDHGVFQRFLSQCFFSFLFSFFFLFFFPSFFLLSFLVSCSVVVVVVVFYAEWNGLAALLLLQHAMNKYPRTRIVFLCCHDNRFNYFIRYRTGSKHTRKSEGKKERKEEEEEENADFIE